MKIFKNIDRWLLAVTIILFAIGTVMIFSASNVSSYMRYAYSPYKYLIRQIIILVIGLFVSLIIISLNIKTISRFSSFICYVLIISLFLLFTFGIISNNAQSWFDLGFFNIQPSEFIKVFVIIWLAKYYQDKGDKGKLNSYVHSLYPIVLCAVAFVLIALQPDLGTAIIFLAIVGVLFLLAGIDKNIKRRIVMSVISLAVIGVLVLAVAGKNILSERQMSRITSVLDSSSPCSEENYYTDGNQVCNGYIAINNGGLTGLGLGNSIQKYLYLPEAHTDFIFCIIIEELGVIFGIFIIFLYIVLLTRIIIIGRRSLNNCNALICYGGSFYIFIHIVVNLAGIFGLIPMTGVPLPFMSYGGSYTICLIVILTVIQRINVETRLTLERAREREENSKKNKNKKRK